MTTINYAISVLGAIGPFAILAGIGYLLWRRRRVLQPRHV
jgi:LPXTG-motif cell wall-anchored protein